MKTLFMLALLVLLAASVQAANLKTIRGPINMDYGASPRFAVVFNHDSHKDFKCRLCHHMKTEQGERFVNCTIEPCHSKAGAREREPTSMFMAYHARGMDRSCYGCHKMEAKTHPEFKGCRPCHMSPMTREQIAKKASAEQAAK